MSTPPKKRLNGEDFEEHGPEFEAAWNIVRGCEIPPSFEVFNHGFKLAAEREDIRDLTVRNYAQRIRDKYQRIR